MQAVPNPSGQNPTGAYATLQAASTLLDGADIPAVVPNDVYQIALTLNSDLELVSSALRQSKKMAIKNKAKGKSPTDVYVFAQSIHANLKQLSETNPKLGIPGGVVLLKDVKGKKSPAQVINLLNNILADIGAFKLALGTKSPTNFAPAQTGKTPSNVYDSLVAAGSFIENLE